MKDIVFATNNEYKLKELREIAAGKLNILSLKDIGCFDDIPETGATLEENALIKARWVKERYGYDCFADDTGLEVEALGGNPGVYSARYAPGAGHDSTANMQLLLKNLENIDDRKARFRTVIALIKDDNCQLIEGVVEGEITRYPCGTDGFGYDPVFQPCNFDITFAQMTAEQKNAISHRGRATRRLIEILGL